MAPAGIEPETFPFVAQHLNHCATTVPIYIHIHIHTHIHTCTYIELSEISVGEWQTEWDQTTKGKITKEYFPVVADRLNMRINITHNFTSMVI